MTKKTLTPRGQRMEPDEGGPLGNLPGLLHHLADELPVSVEEMNESIRERIRGKFAAPAVVPRLDPGKPGRPGE